MPTPRDHPIQPSQNLGVEESSKNYQVRLLLLRAWSLDVSCGIDQECVRNVDPGALPDLPSQNLHLIRILII